jgi:hypothetical protein
MEQLADRYNVEIQRRVDSIKSSDTFSVSTIRPNPLCAAF